MRTSLSHAAAALVATAALVAASTAPAAAIEPPTVPAEPEIPPDPPPAPDQTWVQREPCELPGVLPTPPVADLPAAQAILDISRAHEFSTGRGVTVAVIDTGVTPNPRLPRLVGGGDYVVEGDGLTDCDMHGTLVASLIGAAPSPEDPFVGIAPGVDLISIRQTSTRFRPERPPQVEGQTPAQVETAGRLDALAAAVVHAANMGAKVINMSVTACLPAAHPVNQDRLAVALRYAAVVKDVVLVASAGNVGAGNADCQANPGYDPLSPEDPRNWEHVVSVSTPSWFSDYVISVGAVDNKGAVAPQDSPAAFSMPGPWVSLAAPGVDIVAAGPDGRPVNARPGRDGLVNIFGTSFAAAYVSGTAALVRARFPELSAAQVRQRLTATAHAGPRGLDNFVGHGLVDPVAALTYDLVPVEAAMREPHREQLIVPPPPPPPDRRPLWWAVGLSAAFALGAAVWVKVLARSRS